MLIKIMVLTIITIATFCATLLGGWFALRLKDRLHLVLGFSAGAVVAVAFFELMPEAFEIVGQAYSASVATGIMAVGFIIYMVIDRLLLLHSHSKENGTTVHRGHFSAGSLSLHSFLDGIGIGLAFKISPALGAVVATAVLTHDFSDGINAVNLVLKNGGDRKLALRWLLADAIAPVLGVIVTLFFSVSETSLGILLSLFAGFFLYLGATDLLPESHHAHPVRWTTLATLVGMGVLYLVIRIAHV